MDKALKQRLVGATVLIILAVIVLPMLLSGRSDTLKQESRRIELPTKPDELSIETRRFPVGTSPRTVPDVEHEAAVHPGDVDPAQTQDTQNNAASVLEKNSGTSLQLPVEQDKTTMSKTDISAKTTAGEAVAEAGSPTQNTAKLPAVSGITLSSGRAASLSVSGTDEHPGDVPRYLVQVASFSSEANANSLASRLRAENWPVLMDVVDRVAGRLHRVRIGPYEERTEADAVVSGLRSITKDLNLTPRVLDLRPSDSSPVSTPSDPLVRWVVQVGSFSTPKSAEALVVKLRLAGLAAFSEKVSSANETAFKVRIGPEIDRDKAIELARKVNAEHGLNGFVTTRE